MIVVMPSDDIETLAEQYACVADLRAERDLFRDEALPQAALIMNQLSAERDGWRHENDRHRDLYVAAVKERDELQLRVDQLVVEIVETQAQLEERDEEWRVKLANERDRLRADIAEALVEARAARDAMDEPVDCFAVVIEARFAILLDGSEAIDG